MSYKDEIRAVLAQMDNQQNDQSQDTNTQAPADQMQDVYVYVIRETELEEADQTNIVESAPAQAITQVESEPAKPPVSAKQPFPYFTLGIVFICCIPMLASILAQIYLLQNPTVATITIIPKSQQVTLSGTLQLGRVLPPLTISQSQTTKATGHGHQPAEQARGFITLYNGQFQTVTVSAGTIFTGSSGVQIITDQDATIPAGNPSTGYGHSTVSAHTINPGSSGNIPADDINQACCATSVLVVNLTSFHGGQNERDFSTVTTQDMHKISTPLKIAVTQSMHGALQSQLKPSEQLSILPCSPTVTSDHQPGQEATTVKVTVSQTCSAAAYNRGELQIKATALLTTQADKKFTGYSLFGSVQVQVKQISVTSTTPHLVFLSFHASSTWIYGISPTAQKHIMTLITGKPTQQAQHILAALPGVEQASIRFSGFGDNTRLPKNTGYIHVTIFVV